MWIDELSKVYTEANVPWGPFTVGLPGNARGVPSPIEIKNSYRAGNFGASGQPPDLYNSALGDMGNLGGSPVGEEEEGNILLDFDHWWKVEGGQMNFPSPEIEEASKRLAHNAWRASRHFYKNRG